MADDPKLKTWSCKIGEVDVARLREAVPNSGADVPMRAAVEAAYRELTGEEPAFTFCGWGGSLSEGERAAYEDRRPGATMLTHLRGKVYLPDLFVNDMDHATVTLDVRDGGDRADIEVRLPDGSRDIRRVDLADREDLVSAMIDATRRAWQHALDTGPDPTRIPDSPGPNPNVQPLRHLEADVPVDPPRPPDDRPVA